MCIFLSFWVHDCTCISEWAVMLSSWPCNPTGIGNRKFAASQLKLKFRAVNCWFSHDFCFSAFCFHFCAHSLLSFIQSCLFLNALFLHLIILFCISSLSCFLCMSSSNPLFSVFLLYFCCTTLLPIVLMCLLDARTGKQKCGDRVSFLFVLDSQTWRAYLLASWS